MFEYLVIFHFSFNFFFKIAPYKHIQTVYANIIFLLCLQSITLLVAYHFKVNEITENEDVIWLLGTNQGTEKSNTYLATKSNGQFENSPSEGGKREMGMGVPETGNSGWGIMLAVTSGGERRGFSFERRGKAYRYVEDWMMENEDDEMTEGT